MNPEIIEAAKTWAIIGGYLFALIYVIAARQTASRLRQEDERKSITIGTLKRQKIDLEVELSKAIGMKNELSKRLNQIEKEKNHSDMDRVIIRKSGKTNVVDLD